MKVSEMAPSSSRNIRPVCGRSAWARGALHGLLWSMLLVSLLRAPICAANGAVQTGYAALVRRVAPSVVTVIVEEKRVSAGLRAAEHANPDAGTDTDTVNELIRRLLSGASGNRSADERAAAALRARWQG